MTRTIKKLFMSFIFVGAMSASNGAWAVATADAPNLGAQIHENIQDAIDWGKEKAMMMADMDLKSLLSKFEIDSMYNGFANMISRTGAAMQNIQNLELMEKMAADINICGNVSYSLYAADIGCGVDDETYSKSYQKGVDRVRFTMVDENYRRFQAEKAKALVDECALMTDADIMDPTTSQMEALQYSQCFQVGKLFGTGVAESTLTAVESEAMENAIEMLVDPIPDEKRSGKMIPGTVEFNKTVLEESRNSLAKIMAMNSLQEIKSWITGVKNSEGKVLPSKMANLDKFISDKDASWEMYVGGGELESNKGSDQIAYPSQLMRMSVSIAKWSASLQLEQFKQQLRQEGLVAMQLALMAEDR